MYLYPIVYCLMSSAASLRVWSAFETRGATADVRGLNLSISLIFLKNKVGWSGIGASLSFSPSPGIRIPKTAEILFHTIVSRAESYLYHTVIELWL
jgi:hypothetical protein